MSRRGRRASLPPAGHARPEPLSPDGLLVHHYNREQRVIDFDFSTLAVAEPLQRSLASLFAARCTPHGWTSHETSKLVWEVVRKFAVFLSQQEQPPGDLDDLTVAMMKRWRTSQPRTGGGYNALTKLASLLRGDVRVQSGAVADELFLRVQRPKSKTQSYGEAEFDRIKAAARRTFRRALLRIGENARHLERWHGGEFPEGSREWIIGEALDILARTGTLPYTTGPSGQRNVLDRFRRALGGDTWRRLFLSRMEATALAVLLMAEYGWNLSVIDRAEVPRASPDPGEDGHPTYRIPLEKHRRGAGHFFETRNVTDDGALSSGRLITEALAVTRFARAVVEGLAPGTDLLMVWRAHRPGRAGESKGRHESVGPFRFGIQSSDAKEWGQAEGVGSPFRRGRRTVNVIDRRSPGQNSQESHDRHYALVDKRVQDDAIEVIAAGAEDAADRARRSVLLAELRDGPDVLDLETATADCHDYHNGPYPAPGGGCGASFLMCLGCENARVHPGHHPRLAHLHHALANLRSVLAPAAWDADWGDAHARLEDLRKKLGEGMWAQASARVTQADRELIDHLLTGDLDT
ncbi:hypothetical protein [Actinacidiphila bryophytorum]|uniref:hypothetical protein n=1 Tax=Actinacidiphila bryophytorum TaxID=1436133 RepID=UPI002176CEBC|nr:hypothetical protein [Actinacidiphila bryophytorum]UWE11931.1 hypothetical protein NYE86_26695 [Actinacidiphila bryophytorum]